MTDYLNQARAGSGNGQYPITSLEKPQSPEYVTADHSKNYGDLSFDMWSTNEGAWNTSQDVVDPLGLMHYTPGTRRTMRDNQAAIQNQLALQKYGMDLSYDTTQQILDEQRAAKDQARADLEPWRTTGGAAVNALADLVAQGPGDYTQSPGYDFRLSEGQKAIERSAAARGAALDPSTMKALNRYGQDYATNDYDNFLNRYYQSLTPYQSLAGVGFTGAQGSANAGLSVANNITQGLENYNESLGSLAQSTANNIANINSATTTAVNNQQQGALGAVGSLIGAIF